MGSLPSWLAGRLSGNSHGAVRAGGVIAILGVAFATAVMEITMAVSYGFKDEITAKLLQFVAPITITAPFDSDRAQLSGFINADEETLSRIHEVVPHARVQPVMTLQGMLKTDSNFDAILLKATPDSVELPVNAEDMVDGEWLSPDGSGEIVMSTGIASGLGLEVGSRVNFCYIVEGSLKVRPLKVKGIYDTGLADFDNLIAFVNPVTLQKIYHSEPGEYVSLEVRGIPLGQVDDAAAKLSQMFNERAVRERAPELAFNVERVTVQGALYLSWLSLLDTNVTVIFILMTLVAACTLVSALFIQVLEKVSTIGLFRALGARNGMLARMFAVILLRYVVTGIIIGNILGLGFIFVQSYWHLLSLDSAMYYLRYVPVKFDLTAIILINAGVFVVSWLIVLLPARIATRMSPGTTLRYD